MKKLLYIERLIIAVLLLLMMALAPVRAQNVGFTGKVKTFGVNQNLGDTYMWELYDNPNVDFALVPGNCPVALAEFVGANTGESVDVLFKKAGFYFYKVTASNVTGCAMNFKIGIIEVKVSVTAVITPPLEDVCVGNSVALEINFTGTAPWKFDYSATVTNDDGTTTTTIHPWPDSEPGIMDKTTMFEIVPAPTKTTVYTIIKVSDYYGTNTEPSNTVTQVIYPLPDPSDIYHR